MASISYDKVCRNFDGGVQAIRELNLEIKDGELMVVVGPSGCGKSTLLRMTAGLEEISSGEIRINDRVVNLIPPQQRNLAMVFQNYALYPHMTVRQNLEFPLRMQKQSAAAIQQKVIQIARMLDLTQLLERKPKALSGGQRQRVAMGRAIIREADLFLMDEPLSNLDARLRVEIRNEIARLQRELATTTLYVTHDQAEAMILGQRVAVINGGALLQVGPPREIYERPANAFVARFIGSPGMNLFHATLCREKGELLLNLGPIHLPLPQQLLTIYPGIAARCDEQLLVGIRPHAVQLANDPSGQNLSARICSVEAMGHETILHLDTELLMQSSEKATGDTAHLLIQVTGNHHFTIGEQLNLRMQAEQLCFFDGNGEAMHN
ncbi:MAG: ABC transporter ATP-binding protein [Candidatus Thiodiazotropha sp.]